MGAILAGFGVCLPFMVSVGGRFCYGGRENRNTIRWPNPSSPQKSRDPFYAPEDLSVANGPIVGIHKAGRTAIKVCVPPQVIKECHVRELVCPLSREGSPSDEAIRFHQPHQLG